MNKLEPYNASPEKEHVIVRKLSNDQTTAIYVRYSTETDQTSIGRQAAADDTALTGSILAYARKWSRQPSLFSKIRNPTRRWTKRWTTTAAEENAKTYAVYARSATFNPASIARQIERSTEYARALGATLVAEYVDNGVAGTTNKRPALARLIRDGKQGRFGDLIVEDLERISRTLSGRFGVIDALERQGISIHSLEHSLACPTQRPPGIDRASTLLSTAAVQFSRPDDYVDQFREDCNRSARSNPMVAVSNRLVRSARTTIRRLSRLISAVLPKRAGK